MENIDSTSGHPDSLRTARRELGYTQESLAASVGVTRQAVVAWEAGQKPSGPALRMLSALLSLPLEVIEGWWAESKPEAA